MKKVLVVVSGVLLAVNFMLSVYCFTAQSLQPTNQTIRDMLEIDRGLLENQKKCLEELDRLQGQATVQKNEIEQLYVDLTDAINEIRALKGKKNKEER